MWNPTDHADLVTLLTLPREELKVGSTLSKLMSELLDFDNTYVRSQQVPKVQDAIARAKNLKAALDNPSASYTFISVTGEYMANQSATYRQDLEKLHQATLREIRHLLDPENRLRHQKKQARVFPS